MLSKIDIQKEIGTGICIYPLKLENIKENSINLCAGKYAWVMDDGTIYCNPDELDKDKRFSLKKDSVHTSEIKITKCQNVVFQGTGNKAYIVLLPMATTLIETDEVLSMSGYIGGTYHSKVGLVSKGLGHIGTMVGPNFSGDSLIAFHNISKDLIVLEVGESFVSVVFHYLKTAYYKPNATTSGHTDKFSELGIHLSEYESQELNADWKKQYDQVQRKLMQSDSYKELQNILKESRHNYIKKLFNRENIVLMVIAVVILALLYGGAFWMDHQMESTIWTDRFWNVGFSGILVAIFSALIRQIQNNTKQR